MRNSLNVVACAVLTGAIALLPLTASGQAVFPGPTLVGPGSTIGVTVTELVDVAAAGATTGVRVERVQDGSPASRAGFEAGDIVVEFDGERVRSARQFRRLVEETPPNRQVQAVVIRAGARQTLAVTPELGRAARAEPLVRLQEQLPLLRQQPLPRQQSPALRVQPFALAPGAPRLGVTVIEVEGQLAQHYGVPGGVLVTSVDADSPAARAGLRAGDVITRAGSRDVRGAADLTAAVAAAGQGAAVDLRVRRDGKDITVQATVLQQERPARPEVRSRI